MKVNKPLRAFVITISISIATFSSFVIVLEEASAYTPHAPIRIHGNGDFTAANGVTGGNGIPSDPYIMEGWEIDASSQVGVWFWDTNAHFTIRIVYIHSGSWNHHAIIFENVTNFRIENGTFSNNAAGVHIIESANGAIAGNSISLNDWGIGLVRSINVTITGNVFEKDGIRLWGETEAHYDSHDITVDNMVNGLPVYYHKKCSNAGVDGVPIGQLIIANCTDVSVANLQFTEADAGIQLAFVRNALIYGSNASYGNQGIYVWFSTNVIVRNNSLIGNVWNGIGVYSSSSFIIANNQAYSNDNGIYTANSRNVNITTNEAIDNRFGIRLWETGCANVTGSVAEKNDIGVLLQYSNNSIILGNNVSGRLSGIKLHDSHDNLVMGNTVSSENSWGIDIIYSDRNAFVNNIATNSQDGFNVDFSDRNSFLSNSMLSNRQAGINLWSSNANVITNNSILNNVHGFEIYDSNGNMVANNTIALSSSRGATLANSDNNWVYHNNITDNFIQAIDDTDSNHWDIGYPLGGNYWSEYGGGDQFSGPNQDMSGSDGIGDIPYVIDSDSQDRYPLLYPPGTIPPRQLEILSVILTGLNLENVTLAWSLSPDDGQGNMSIVGYQVYRNMTHDSDGAGYALIASLPNGTSVFVDDLAGEGDSNNYFYRICSLDVGGNISCAEAQGGKFTRQLSVGPILVSIPLVQSDTSTIEILQTVKFDKAWTYDSSTLEWKSYVESKPYKGKLMATNHRTGVWMNVVESSNFTVAGLVPPTTALQLRAGWNLVSFPSFNSTYAVSDLNGETGATRVEGCDPSNPPYYLKILGVGDLLQAGYGYWVYVEVDTTWLISNS